MLHLTEDNKEQRNKYVKYLCTSLRCLCLAKLHYIGQKHFVNQTANGLVAQYIP